MAGAGGLKAGDRLLLLGTGGVSIWALQIARAMDGLAHGTGILPEMIDPTTGDYLGNLPQGLSHLALIQAIATLGGAEL